MTLAIATVRPSARAPRGWRPSQPGEVPTLGWGVLAHAYAHLRSPVDETQPFRFTDEQARHVLRIYALDEQGRRLYRRVHEEQAKGWGKSPFASHPSKHTGPVNSTRAMAAANGQPVGVPWGTHGRPAPWVQIAAVSEDQTANTYNALYGLLTADGGKVAESLHIDDGRTRLYRTDMPAAFLERVTASAGSREGQPLTHADLDEPQLWYEENSGVRLARTILRNLAKTGGWGMFTGNAPIRGLGSVAELFGEPAEGALHLSNRPSEKPQQDWSPERLRDALDEVYGDAWWVPRERVLQEIADPAQPWHDSLRFFFNIPGTSGGEDAWLPAGAWEAGADASVLDPDLPVGVGIRKAPHSDHAAVVVAQKQPDGRVVARCRMFAVEEATGRVSSEAIRQHLRELRLAFPRAMVRDAKTRRHIPGPAFAYDRVQFAESAEMLDQDGLNMVEVNQTAAVLAPPSTVAYELVATGRLIHDGDPVFAAHVAAARSVLTERGMRVAPSKSATAPPSHAAVALVMAVAMAMQEAPAPFVRTPRVAVGF